MKASVRKYVKWFFPLLFVGYFFCISLFEHTHIVDGVIVAHSHAIKGEGGAVPHQHSSNSEIFQYHFLSHFAVSDGVVHVLTLRFIFSLLACLTSVPVAPGYFLSVERCLSLRAPPVI